MGFVGRNPGLWCRIPPLIFGMACLGQFLNYGLVFCTPTDHPIKCTLGVCLGISTIVAFPIIVLPILLTAHIKRAELYESIMNPLFYGLAIIFYLITGSLGIHIAIVFPDYPKSHVRQVAVSVFCFICAVQYTVSFIFWIKKQRQGGPFVEPPIRTLVASGAV